MRIAIVGAGGHGEVVADIIRMRAKVTAESLEVVAFLDDNPARHGRCVAGTMVLGGLESASTVSADAFVVAIGTNDARARTFIQLCAAGHALLSVVHPDASVGGNVEIDSGTMISAGAIVVTGSRIGRGVILNTGCSVDHHARIGDFVHIAPGARLGGEVSVGERAMVGMGAVVLPRVRLGAGCTVGAGAVVIRDVAEGTTVVGVPARQMDAARVSRSTGVVAPMNAGGWR
jgi:sugar O-acyltransferase (sialic acid O-acetyltransferase NeuD family)